MILKRYISYRMHLRTVATRFIICIEMQLISNIDKNPRETE